MKKFLIYLVSIVVVVCLGLTTYYFMRNDETINFKTKEIYCNAGDIITLKQLGYTRVKADKDTKINYNAGGETVTSHVAYDSEKGYYIVGQNGGDVTLIIKTSNKRFPEFKVIVHIGNGEEASPYYIDDEEALSKIGRNYGLDKHYILRNDIKVSNAFKTIGYDLENEVWAGFSGNFNGNGYTISGLKLSPTDTENVGLFSTINTEAVVKNLRVLDSEITGSFRNAGVLAGIIEGSVSRVCVENSKVSNSAVNGKTGALAGLVTSKMLTTSKAVNVQLITSGENAIVGGLVGEINRSAVMACYSLRTTITANENAVVGGFVGSFVIGTDKGTIQQSYADSTCENSNFGTFIGSINQADNFDVNNAVMLKYLVGNKAVGTNNVVNSVNVDKKDGENFFVEFEDVTNAYYLISAYETEDELISRTEHIFYAYSPSNKVYWDTNIWAISGIQFPDFKDNSLAPTGIDSQYFARNLNTLFVFDASDIVSANSKNFILQKNITLPADWVAKDIENCVITGNGYTITFSGDYSLFNNVKESTISDLNLVNVTANGVNGAVANSIEAESSAFVSKIENVNVTYVGTTNGAETFGGLVGTAKNAIINNCSVTGLNLNGESQVTAGGLVGKLDSSTVSNCSVNSTVSAKQKVGGFVGENTNGTVTSVSGNVNVQYSSQISAEAFVGGLVAQNNGLVNNSNVNVVISVSNASSKVNVGGVAGVNNGTIETITISGEGITLSGDFNSVVAMGGVAAINNNKISNTNVLINRIGGVAGETISYRAGKQDIAGGVAVYNSAANSKISKVVVSSDIYGNIAAGVVAYMQNSESSNVSEVLVAKLNLGTKQISDNTIKGDLYVAGVCFDLRLGTIENIQTSSNIVGGANTTRSSLAVLIFPYGANFRNSTINSSFEGNGYFYVDTWNNFYETPTISGDFGIIESDRRFNLYGADSHCGCFQSVVINTEKAISKGVYSVSASKFTTGSVAFGVYNIVDYEDTAESSYYKTANNGSFADANIFKQNWNVKVTNAGWFGGGLGNPEFSRPMTFDIGGVWAESNGITLSFIANI